MTLHGPCPSAAPIDIDIAVVPVAGLGTRLLPATKSQPKEMLPVGRKPVVQYVVEELARVGTRRLLFVTGQGKASIENHFDLNAELIQTLRETGKEDLLAELAFERAPVQYFFTRQRQLLGLGHAILCARSFVGRQPFIVALGDSIIGMHAESDVVRRMTGCFEERMFLTRERAYARAGLLGNPSDGYHGKTISISVRNFWAEVVLYEWDTVDIVLAEDDRARFGSVRERQTAWCPGRSPVVRRRRGPLVLGRRVSADAASRG